MIDLGIGTGATLRLLSATLLLAVVLSGCHDPLGVGPDRKDSRREIRATLEAQAEAWNRGDLERFMADYLRSEELTFISDGSIQRGWDAAHERYVRRYPDRSAMGRVTFSEIDVRMLGTDNAVVLGKWQVHRDVDPIGGRFTLVMQHGDGGWVIIHDHTSTNRGA